MMFYVSFNFHGIDNKKLFMAPLSLTHKSCYEGIDQTSFEPKAMLLFFWSDQIVDQKVYIYTMSVSLIGCLEWEMMKEGWG